MTTIEQIKEYKARQREKRISLRRSQASYARSRREETYQKNENLIDRLRSEFPISSLDPDLVDQTLNRIFPIDRETRAVLPSKRIIYFLENLEKFSIEVIKDAMIEFQFKVITEWLSKRKKPPAELFYGFLKLSKKKREKEGKG